MPDTRRKCIDCLLAARRGGLIVCPINPVPRRGITPGCKSHIDPQLVMAVK